MTRRLPTQRLAALLILVLIPLAPASAQTLLIKPYIQHGDQSAVGATDAKVIAFTTDATPGDFTLEFSSAGQPAQTVPAKSTPLDLALENAPKLPGKANPPPPRSIHWLMYRADLSGLPLATTIDYRLLLAGKPVASGSFITRKPPTGALDFVVFGDSGMGTSQQAKIAYQVSLKKPEFIMHVGDNVYDRGRISQYLSRFWSCYDNAEIASPKTGAPIMRSAPWYVALGNHDIDGADLAAYPDGMAACYFFYWPNNGPPNLKARPPLGKSADRIAAFQKAVGDRFPGCLNYSFDNGPAHFLCLDANRYINVQDPALRDWVTADLAASRLPWKFVFFHQPGFSDSKKHFEEQRMRALSPIFQKNGVDMVFCGHVHNYQRTMPFTFAPELDSGRIRIRADGHVPGQTTIDKQFDGKEGSHTVPQGILYIITGAGGAGLVSQTAPPGDNKLFFAPAAEAPAPTTAEPATMPAPAPPVPSDDVAEYLAQYVADRWSFTHITLDSKKLTLEQIDADGKLFDQIVVTKP
jgi:acid phosphatase type 7